MVKTFEYYFYFMKKTKNIKIIYQTIQKKIDTITS